MNFKDWVASKTPELLARYHNYERWDTTGSPTVVIRITNKQDKRAIFKSVGNGARFTLAVYDDDTLVIEDEYIPDHPAPTE